MNYKEKIEKYVAGFTTYVDSLVNLGSMDYESKKELRSNMVEELTTLYEQAQRDAVEGFVRSKHVNVYGDIPSLNEIELKAELLEADKYLNQTKEDKQ